MAKHIDIRSAHIQLQICMDWLSQGSVTYGFRFSTDKSEFVHFCLGQLRPLVALRLYGRKVSMVPVAKCLGMTLDRRLSYALHITQLRDKCFQRMNVLKVVSRTSYGANRVTLIRFYRAIVRSAPDYDSVAYFSVLNSVKQPLNQPMSTKHV